MATTKRFRGFYGLVSMSVLALGLSAGGGGDAEGASGEGGEGGGDELATIGCVAVGPEGAWRQANGQDGRDTLAEDAGVELKFAPATNRDQKSQIEACAGSVAE